MHQALRIVFAGGGTGGHLFPGIAMAQEFMARNSSSRMLFISTGNELEQAVLSRAGFALRPITAAGIKGRGIFNQLKAALKIPWGMVQALGILKNFSPDLVLGLGSYSAGPVVMAAWLSRIPSVIHEQNILPGITNRILARFVRRIYVSFENTPYSVAPEKIYWTGNPVRQELLAEDASIEDSGRLRFTVLIIGGSQGAHRINMAVIEALAHFKKRQQLHFVHQTGQSDEQAVQEAYRQKAVSATVQAFFDDMARQYRRADLIVCRAGATTVAEITALGKAAIFIPFPHAADNHQLLNATDLTRAGAAEMIVEKELTGERLCKRIEHYCDHRQALKDMAARAQRFGKPQAAKDIVDDCYRLLTAGNPEP
jgi:UDP-N-acetylglucosamine--N-acetylmuramyl-(pentapeptide) pyrophosphoryl-undecaprenol N-acetylglucosamine transferase